MKQSRKGYFNRNKSHQRHQNDTDCASQLRAIFGLNFLQDMKGEPAEITGAYDPKQERWIMQEPIQELETPIRPSTRRATINATWRGTNTGGGRDRDSEQDQHRDMNDESKKGRSMGR